MEADRWDQLAVFFEQAQALAPGERAAFLDEACGGDADLRAQLEALLGTDGEARAYFESLVGDVFAPPQAKVTRSEARPPRSVGHYEVLEKLGGGGMGVVYKARDVGLDRIVALKFLPPHLSANDEAKQRFIAEAKAASALDHTNICTIHEIGETDDGQLFIAMACYDGQTLKRKIKDKPLPLDEALDVAVQIARGLEKAHARGIVHRDIKPANVMVTDDGVVKILDFGLAKVADLQLTKTGTTMGTVAYMSPEQARGDKVDHRTDIWSLGVVLYEMLTGQRPATGDFEAAIVYAILHEEPASITRLNPDLPPDLEHVVAMCLEKERDLRYATMEDLLADLQVFVQGSGSDLSAAVVAARRRAVTKRRRRVMAGTAAAVVVLIALALLIPASRQALLAAVGVTSSSAPTYVAVLPFPSTNPKDQALTDGLVQDVTGMVARLDTAKDSLWVIPASEIISRGIKNASEARKMLGAHTVIQVAVQHIGSETRVNLNLVDPNAEVARTKDSARLPLDSTFQEKALVALAGFLKTRVGQQIRQAATLDRPTSLDAYTFYHQGAGYLQRYHQPGNIGNAITLFTQAIEEDSLYALAYAGLCEATWEQYRNTTDTNLAEAALQHCDHAATLAEGQASVLVSLGSVYLGTGQHKKAEATLLRARELEPDNADALRWLGRVYEDIAQHSRAEAAFRQAIALRRNVWIYYNELGILLGFQGRYAEAFRQFEQVKRLTPDNYLAYIALANMQLELNNAEEAQRLYEHALALQPSALAYRNLGRLFFREQQYEKAVRAIEQALGENEEDLIAWDWLAHAYYWAGNHTEARAAWQHTLEQAALKLAINPKDDVTLYLLADAHVALGDREQGLFFMQRMLTLPQEDILMKYYIGRTYEMLNLRDLALNWIEQALEAGFHPVTPDHDPWLEALRQDPRYQELRRQYPDTEPAPSPVNA